MRLSHGIPTRSLRAFLLRAGSLRAGLLCASLLCAPHPAASQVAVVAEAVADGVSALTTGDPTRYLDHFSPQARVILVAEGRTELDPTEFVARIADATWTPEPVEPQVFGGLAVTVLRLDGTLEVAGGGTVSGRWRYAETRTRSARGWRISQVEVSPLESPARRTVDTSESGGADGGPAAAGGGAPEDARPGAGGDARSGGDGAPGAGPGRGGEAADGGAGATASAGGVASPGGVASDQPDPFTLPPGVPSAPSPPDVIRRDAAGNATVRAIRLDRGLDLDGELSEPVYGQVPPLDDFIQSLPDEGEPATELTEAWIMYDDDNVYVAARVHEEVPEEQWVANEMRRDGNQVGTNDNFGLVFDTYYDRRNGYFFYTNPLGAMVDVQVTNEGSPNFDWNPVWDVRTGRFEGGWTVEVRIPFKSIRYSPGSSQLWGVQLRRAIRRKNEWSHLTPVSRQAAGDGRMGIIRMSRAATLVGIEAPPQGVNIDVKPYGIGSLTTDRSAGVQDEWDGDGGVDLKWGITQNLAADFTYNTDFAQVEVDEQQVNLTRFNLFFPEKREFFLESRGIFNFPASGVGGGRGGGNTPTLFFSRRIGLQGGTPVPIIGGGRLTGKVGPFDIGALDIVTDEVGDVGAEQTNFTVVRMRADILERSNVGALYTRRSQSLVADSAADGAAETYGGDVAFSLFQDWYLSGYLARTRTPGIDSRDLSYQGRFNYDGDEAGFGMSHLLVEQDFNPEVGFLRRRGFRQSQASARLSPRPESIASIRQVRLEGAVDYIENAEVGFVESREISGTLGVELELGDQITVNYANSYENLQVDESISGVAIPAGRYEFDAVEASYQFGPQRFFSGTLSGRYGTWFNGNLTSAGFSRGRIEVTPQLSLEPSVSLNWIDVPGDRSMTTLALTRVNYTFTPRMFLSALVQYNSSNDRFSANARFRWEYAPGSEIFLVYTEERNTYDFERFPELSNRGLVLKVTRLLRL